MGILGISPTVIANQCLDRYFDAFGLHSRLVELDNGTTMHCWMPKFPSIMQEEMWRSSGKPSLVLLHAFGLDAYTWGRQVSRFSKSFDLYIPDLVFSGKSFTTSKERSEIFQAECVLKLLHQLNVFKFSVVGTSYGGFVAYRIAHMYPHAVHKLVLSSSAVNMSIDADHAMVEKFKVKDVTEILQPNDVEGVRRVGKLAFHWEPPFSIPAFICNDILEVLINKNRKEKLELLAGLQLRNIDASSLPKVSQEVLVIWGEYDPVFNIALAHKLKESIGDNAELEIIKNAAHVPQAEIPKEYNRKVARFLLRPPRKSLASL